MLGLVNQQRTIVRDPPLQVTSYLQDQAQEHYGLQHTRVHCKGRERGQNLAWGYANPQEAVQAWMASTGHRANILRKTFRLTGVATKTEHGVKIYVQDFCS